MLHRSRALLQAALLQLCRAARQCTVGGGGCGGSSAFGSALRCLSAVSATDPSSIIGQASSDIHSNSHWVPTHLQSARQGLPSKCSSSRLADLRGVDYATAVRMLQLATCQDAAACGLAASGLQVGTLATFGQQRRWYAGNGAGSGGSGTAFAASSPPLEGAQPSHLAQMQSSKSSPAPADNVNPPAVTSYASRPAASIAGSWLERRCPRSLLPYAQLMRLDKPIGDPVA